MGDEDVEVKVEYLDAEEGAEEVYNWVKRAGKARVTYPSGSTFEGSFNAERLKDGHGVYTWRRAEGEDEEIKDVGKYEGEYKDGKRHGIGKITYPNGDTYHGEWDGNARSGEGTYVYAATGDIFSGSWEADVKVGQGSYMFGADRSQLVGTWVTGTITEGKWAFTDGGNFTGRFVDGQPLGEGVITMASGITQSGTYSKVAVDPENEDSETTLVWSGNSVVVN